MNPLLRRFLPGVAGLSLFAAVLGAEFGVLWAWQAQASRQWASGRQPPISQPQPPAALPVAPPERAPAARLAVVIDDWGYAWEAADSLLRLDGPLTVAVIPFLPKSHEYARLAMALGHEVLVHLPMEPIDRRRDPGPDAITTALSDAEIDRRVEAAVRAVPGAVGLSNHMGSRATADARVMQRVLAVLARHRMFFLDSATTPQSAVPVVASREGVPWARNRVFLDGAPGVDYVKAQLLRAARLALRDGEAIAIGHVRMETARALEQALPEVRRMGVEIVPVSALVSRRGSHAGPVGKMRAGDVP